MAPKKQDRHQQKIVDARQEVLHRLGRVRQSLDREVSWLPTGEKWLLPLAALAVGMAVATKGSAKRKSAIPESADDDS